MDAKAQSALDLKKQNLKDETKKRKELVKSMEEVIFVKTSQIAVDLPQELQFNVKLY